MDEVLCPFCENDAWSDSEPTPCGHLLVNWDLDPGDNAGGVLGEMYISGGALDYAEDLALISRKLCAWAWSAGKDRVQARLKLAANAVPEARPPWWAVLERTILDCHDPEAVVNCENEDDDDFSVELEDVPLQGPPPPISSYDPSDPVTLAEFANPMAEAVVEDLPGINVTYEILGGMTSGTLVFVWSEDPAAGQSTIDAAFVSAIDTVEMIIRTLGDIRE
jgi:hypothetical protein